MRHAHAHMRTVMQYRCCGKSIETHRPRHAAETGIASQIMWGNLHNSRKWKFVPGAYNRADYVGIIAVRAFGFKRLSLGAFCVPSTVWFTSAALGFQMLHGAHIFHGPPNDNYACDAFVSLSRLGMRGDRSYTSLIYIAP